MALQFKRGLEANRTSFTPAEGEIIYTTDQQKVYIGDGITAGGILVNGLSSVAWNDVTDKPTFSAVATSGNYTDLLGQPTIPSSIFDLGIVDGDANQVLTTDGAGNISWQTVTSGGVIGLDELTDVTLSSPQVTGDVLTYNGVSWTNTPPASGLTSRVELSGSTGLIINGADGTVNLTGFKGYMLYKISTDAAAWVRIYVSSSAQIADSSRSEGADPLPGSGVIAEIITTGIESIVISPGVIGFNDDNPVADTIYISVRNKTGSDADITVTLTAVELEV